jgi:chromosome segregation ATPase
VPRFLVERRLRDNTARLRKLRDELRVLEEQHDQLADEADDSRLRSLVSETPLADREFRETQRHADAFAKRRAELVASIAALDRRQDELLDRLSEGHD